MQFSVKQLFSLQLSIFFYFHNKSSFYTLNAMQVPSDKSIYQMQKYQNKINPVSIAQTASFLLKYSQCWTLF